MGTRDSRDVPHERCLGCGARSRMAYCQTCLPAYTRTDDECKRLDRIRDQRVIVLQTYQFKHEKE